MSYSSLTRFKRCPSCGAHYPRTHQFWGTDNRRSQGLHVYCRICRAQPEKRTFWLATMFCPPGFQACTKCAEIKPHTDEFFHRNITKSGDMALRHDCKLCNTARVKDYYRENREVIIKRVVEYNKNSVARQEYMVAYLKEWQKRNPHYKRDQYRRWREEASAEEIERERLRMREKENRRRAAKLLSGTERVDPAIVEQMYDDQEGLCAYCEHPLFGTYHLDHMVPLSRGGEHHWTNFAITCPRCNIRKSNKTADEYWLLIKP